MANGAEDGVFWICFEDVLVYFDCIDICKVSYNFEDVLVYFDFIKNLTSLSPCHQPCARCGRAGAR